MRTKMFRTLMAATAVALVAIAQNPIDARGDDQSGKDAGLGYVIVGANDSVQVGGATFYPTGPISDDTLVVIADADGNLPGGLTERQIATLVEGGEISNRQSSGFEISDGAPAPRQVTGGTQWAAPLGGGWGAIAKTSKGFIGTTDEVKLRYTFGVTDGTNQIAHGHGRGYHRGYNGSDFGTWAAWYSIGTAQSMTNATARVPWGNVAAVAEFRGKSLNVLHVAIGRFQAGF